MEVEFQKTGDFDVMFDKKRIKYVKYVFHKIFDIPRGILRVYSDNKNIKFQVWIGAKEEHNIFHSTISKAEAKLLMGLLANYLKKRGKK